MPWERVSRMTQWSYVSTGCLDLVGRCLHLPVRGVSSSASSSSTSCSWTAATRALGLLALQDEALASQVAQSGTLQAVAARLSVPALKARTCLPLRAERLGCFMMRAPCSWRR